MAVLLFQSQQERDKEERHELRELIENRSSEKIVMHCRMMGMCSEKCVLGNFIVGSRKEGTQS